MSEQIIPKIVQIEPIFGCNANCIMCPINKPTKRKKGVMTMELFKKIVDNLAPHNDKIEQVDLFGLGEPLLDKGIFDKIKYLKERGLKGVGISTNMDLLDEEKQNMLLESGIDTVIISIDSIKKDIHEQIRRNTDFDRIVANTTNLIKKRDKGEYKTKFVLRFIRQKLNEGEWDSFKEYWDARIDRNKGDQINVYDAHNWVGEVPIEVVKVRKEDVEALKCYQVFDRMFILYDGTMSMCSCDLHHPHVVIGNVADSSPLEVYNSEKMKEIRDLHVSGRKTEIEICRSCNMLYSREKKEIY